MSDGERSAWVGFKLPWRSPLFQVGDRIRVERFFEYQPWQPSTARVEIRDEDGELLVFAGTAGSFGRLGVSPEITVGEGRERCTIEDSCGDYRRASLAVTIGDERVDVGWEDLENVGDFVVANLGYEQPEGPSRGCPDWYVGRASFVAIRGSLASLDALDRGACAMSACDDGQYCATGKSCEATSVTSMCMPAEEACPDECPGVCGCDGRFYCNACLAQHAGFDVSSDESCMQGGCGHASQTTERGNCYETWDCFDSSVSYSVRCNLEADVARCVCFRNLFAVGEFEARSDFRCNSSQAAMRCGFPPSSFAP